MARAPDIHPSRRSNVSTESRKRHKVNPHPNSKKSFKKAYPVNKLKSQVRSLKRFLENNQDIPATIRVEKERALHSVRYELEHAQSARSRGEMIGRWHKIRFFDRQRATRRLKKVKRMLVECDDEAERPKLEQALEDLEIDVNYAIYYPLDVDYVPLFPTKSKAKQAAGMSSNEQGDTKQSQRQGDSLMRERVKQSMVEGSLENLRVGKYGVETADAHHDSDIDTGSMCRDRKLKDTRKMGQSKQDNVGEYESDGGFFE